MTCNYNGQSLMVVQIHFTVHANLMPVMGFCASINCVLHESIILRSLIICDIIGHYALIT